MPTMTRKTQYGVGLAVGAAVSAAIYWFMFRIPSLEDVEPGRPDPTETDDE